MCRLQRLGTLQGDSQRGGDRQPVGMFFEKLACAHGHVFEHKIVVPFILPVLIYGHDGRVLAKRGNGAGLALELAQMVGVDGVPQELDRHIPFQVELAGQVDPSEPTLPQHLLQQQVADLFVQERVCR